MQCHHVFFEIQGTITVGVKAPKDMLCISYWVGVGKKAGVDALKLLPADPATWALLQEGLVPSTQLHFAVLGVQLQFLQELLGQNTAFTVAHT